MKKIKIALLIIISCIILSEAYLRIFNFETLKTRVRDLAYIPDSLYGYRYRPYSVQTFIWPDVSKTFRFNNHGFYGPDFSAIKDKNSFRIIFVGTSNTLGIRTEGNENFVMKLQKLFKQQNYNVEVINCSVDGKDRSIGNINIIKYETIKYNPDIVMFEYDFPLCKEHVARDEYRNYMIRYDFSLKDSIQILKTKVDKIYSAKCLCKLYDVSYTIRSFCRWLDNHKKTSFAKFFDTKVFSLDYISAYIKKEMNLYKQTYKNYFTAEESKKMYADLEKYLKSLHIKFATYSLGGQRNTQQPNYPQYVIKSNLIPALRMKDEGHLNQKGHEIIAKQLFYELIHSATLHLNNYKIK